MPRRDPHRTQLGFWRVVAMVVAAGLGLAAVCLVVFANTQKQLQIGVLLGLWGGLIGAFLVFGSRRSQAEQAAQLADAEHRARLLHEAQLQVSQLQHAQLEAAQDARAKQEVELRKFGEMQLSREAAARRSADLNLEISLRREIERMMTEQLGALRNEVAALRAEVVDKLGGQLRLERIETTRLIGSDLEALQHEIRRLAGSQESIATVHSAVSAPLPQLPWDRPAATEKPGRTARAGHDIVDAELIESEPVGRAAEPAAAPVAEPAARAAEPAVPVAEPAAAPTEPDRSAAPTEAAVPAAWSAPTVVGADPLTAPTVPAAAPEPGTDAAPVPPLYRQSEQVAAFTSSFDPFAGLPRLSPLPDDLELIHDPEPDPPQPTPPGGRRRAPDEEQDARYHGRRRAYGEPEPGTSGRPEATTKSPDPAEQPVDLTESGTGRRRAGSEAGRRRAPDDAPADLLARQTERQS
ncbi:MAG: DUF6779 domain-containing protein [Jatrophihabitans sp.]